MPDEQVCRSPAYVVREPHQNLDDVVGAAQRFGRKGAAHTGKVGVDPAQPCDAVECRLETRLRLAMIDPGTVQNDHRPAGAVLYVMDVYVACTAFHGATDLHQLTQRQ